MLCWKNMDISQPSVGKGEVRKEEYPQCSQEQPPLSSTDDRPEALTFLNIIQIPKSPTP